jgi:hypothetical protein
VLLYEFVLELSDAVSVALPPDPNLTSSEENKSENNKGFRHKISFAKKKLN